MLLGTAGRGTTMRHAISESTRQDINKFANGVHHRRQRLSAATFAAAGMLQASGTATSRAEAATAAARLRSAKRHVNAGARMPRAFLVDPDLRVRELCDATVVVHQNVQTIVLRPKLRGDNDAEASEPLTGDGVLRHVDVNELAGISGPNQRGHLPHLVDVECRRLLPDRHWL